MNGVKEIQEADFGAEVIESKVPVLVDFFAPWCGPCRALAPALEGIAKAYEGRLKVVKVNVDDSPGLAETYRIRGVPTLLAFRRGEVVEQIVGLPSPAVLKQKLDAIAAPPARVGSCGCCA